MVRIALGVLIVLLAALVATGCGGDDGGDGTADVAVPALGAGDPLSWLPAGTWLVASANVGAGTLDDAIIALERLPIWALAEGYLPASDGAGLRLAGLERAAEALGGSEAPAPKQLEAAFGERFGMAVTSNDATRLSGQKPPLVAWIEVDDEQAALTAARALLPGREETGEHRGMTWYESADADATIVVADGLLMLASSPRELERLIDTHDGDTSLADDATGRAVMQAAIGDSVAGFAIQTDPLLEAFPDLLRTRELETVLTSSGVDDLVPDWLGASITLDSTGLRGRGVWSNPRPIAQPDVSARELVERMPVSMPIAQATSVEGDALQRIQQAWSDAGEELDLTAAIDARCRRANQWACDLAAAALVTLLEDESLASALADAGAQTTAVVQNTMPGAATASPTRFVEIATSGSAIDGWQPPSALAAAARRAGLIVTRSADGLTLNVRLLPASPLAGQLRAALTPENASALKLLGVDPRQLLTPKGLTLTAQEADGLLVAGLPQGAPSQVVPALNAEADVIGDARGYLDVVAAVEPPKQTGDYGWIDVPAYVTSVFSILARDNPTAMRATETVRNNLSDIPGALTWSTREEVDGVEVGLLETVAPVLE